MIDPLDLALRCHTLDYYADPPRCRRCQALLVGSRDRICRGPFSASESAAIALLLEARTLPESNLENSSSPDPAHTANRTPQTASEASSSVVIAPVIRKLSTG